MATMQPDSIGYLRCPGCRGELAERADGLRCATCGRSFPVDRGIPLLLGEDPESPEMRRKIAMLDQEMRRYKLVLAALSLATLTWIPAERDRLLRDSGLRPGDRVLDHCTGLGENLPAIAAEIGPDGKLVAMDLSGAMLREARKLAQRKGIRTDIHQADALTLPYADGYFDTVIHYGAINQFEDGKRQAVEEIVRVTKDGGTVVILDEGIRKERQTSLWARLLIARNSLFASQPPLDLLPDGAKPRVRWVVRGLFYEILFQKPSARVQPPLPPSS